VEQLHTPLHLYDRCDIERDPFAVFMASPMLSVFFRPVQTRKTQPSKLNQKRHFMDPAARRIGSQVSSAGDQLPIKKKEP